MKPKTTCPKCGGSTFVETISGSFDSRLLATMEGSEVCVVRDDDMETEESSGYACRGCEWRVVDSDGCPVYSPEDLIAAIADLEEKK